MNFEGQNFPNQNYQNQNRGYKKRSNNNRQWNTGPNNGGVSHNYQASDDKPHIANVVDLNFMTNWYRLHDTFAHSKIIFPKMEKVVKIAQDDAQSPQGNSNKGGGSVVTTMSYELFDEESPFHRKEENE